MLFSEIYGGYFNVVAAILTEATKGCLTGSKMTDLIHEKAFAESALSIPASLKNRSWPLINENLETVIRHEPTMPPTHLQKRWLKALLQDPRIALFAPNTTGLEDVEPLYEQDTFVYFDRYNDGDPYGSRRYIENFRLILNAIHEKRALRIRFLGHTGIRHSFVSIPYRLEYSAKDDKFRLYSMGRRNPYTINLGRILSCAPAESYELKRLYPPRDRIRELTMILRDERNALERVLLHFSHFEKETRRIDDKTYEVKLRYDREDETELLIRVISFGPMLEVKEPAAFVGLIKERLERQKLLALH